MRDTESSRLPAVRGRIGITLLCIYLLAVSARIGGCYAPDAARRDELTGVGPSVGDEFPPFRMRDVSGAWITRDDLRGTTVLIVTVPSLDWSPPSKARLLDLGDALAGRRDVRVAVVTTAAQATPRALRFAHDHVLPFYYLVDDGDLIQRLGLASPGPDGTPSALPATFVLDADGRVRLRDVRKSTRFWLAPEVALGDLAPPP
jgi:peroxiredoxin